MKIRRIFLIIIIVILGYLEYFIISNFDDYTVKSGIIDKNKRVVVNFEYDFINATDLNYNPDYIHVQKNEENFYIDLKGVEHREQLPNFYKNRAAAYSAESEKEGYIDSNFNKISQFIYDYVDDTYTEDEYAIVKIDEKMGLIDIDGNTILSCEYDNIEVVSDGFFLVSKDGETLIINKEEETIAVFNADMTKFKFVLLNDLKDYKEIELEDYFSDDISEIAKDYFLNNHIAIKSDNKIEVFDRLGNKIWDASGEKIEIERDGKDIYICVNQNQDGVIQIIFDEVGNELYRFDNFKSFVSDRSIYTNKVIAKNRMLSLKTTEKDIKFGIIDFSNNTILEQKYDLIYFPNNAGMLKDIYCVKQDEKYGAIDDDGNTIIEPSLKYKDIIYGNKQYFIVKQYNILLFTIFFTLILFIFVVTIFLLLKILKKQKNIDVRI